MNNVGEILPPCLTPFSIIILLYLWSSRIAEESLPLLVMLFAYASSTPWRCNTAKTTGISIQLNAFCGL